MSFMWVNYHEVVKVASGPKEKEKLRWLAGPAQIQEQYKAASLGFQLYPLSHRTVLKTSICIKIAIPRGSAWRGHEGQHF